MGPGDPPRTATRTEYWIVEGGRWWRRTSSEGGFVRGESLIRDGVQWVLQADDLGGKATRTVWFNMLEYDAFDTDQGFGFNNPPMDGDPAFYRAALESGAARLVERRGSSAGETLTLAMGRRWADLPRGTDTTVVVRTEDYLPVRAKSEMWSMSTSGREVVDSTVRHYEVAEVLAWDDVPPGVLELEEPPGVWHESRRHLRMGEAAAMRTPSVWWVGERLGGLTLAEEPSIDASHGGEDRGRYRSLNLGSDPIEWADMMMPMASSVSTEVVVHYEGPRGTDLKVCSVPRADYSRELRRIDREAEDALRWTSVNGRPAAVVHASHERQGSLRRVGYGYGVRSPGSLGPDALSETVTYVVVDMPGATVILQGWQMPEAAVLFAAGELSRIGGH